MSTSSDSAASVVDELPQELEKLGSGSYGQVVLATLNKTTFALKKESVDAKPKQVKYEFKVMSSLNGCRGVPAVYRLWSYPDGSTSMAMALLGKHLGECGVVSVNRVVRVIAPEYIRILRDIHERGFLHRDVKPANMLQGKKGVSLWLVDFGLAKKYIREDGTHIPYREGKKYIGTPRYMSLHTHNGVETSRRDDMESLGYALVYLAQTSILPWSKVSGDNMADRMSEIKRVKHQTHVDVLCKNLPPCFRFYFNHVRSLAFNERPDYALLLSYFSDK
jgi:casein kinase 1